MSLPEITRPPQENLVNICWAENKVKPYQLHDLGFQIVRPVWMMANSGQAVVGTGFIKTCTVHAAAACNI